MEATGTAAAQAVIDFLEGREPATASFIRENTGSAAACQCGASGRGARKVYNLIFWRERTVKKSLACAGLVMILALAACGTPAATTTTAPPLPAPPPPLLPQPRLLRRQPPPQTPRPNSH
jgi:hypothetical protein